MKIFPLARRYWPVHRIATDLVRAKSKKTATKRVFR